MFINMKVALISFVAFWILFAIVLALGKAWWWSLVIYYSLVAGFFVGAYLMGFIVKSICDRNDREMARIFLEGRK